MSLDNASDIDISTTTEAAITTLMEPELPLAKNSTILATLYGIDCSLGIAGIAMNLSLIYTIWKSRNLHSACAFLITYTAVCTLFYQFLIFPTFLLVILPGNHYLTREACYWIQAPAVYGTYGQMNSICAIGVDRFLSVFFPIWYHQRKTKPYLFCLILLASAPIMSIYWVFWQVKISQSPKSLILCTLGELMAERYQYLTNLTFTTHVLTALIYICILVKMRFFRSSAGNTIQNTIFKSLRIIIAIQLLGNVFVQIVFQLQGLVFYEYTTYMSRWILAAVMHIFCNIFVSTDPIVLFYRNHEYRQAFSRQFPFLKVLARKIDEKEQTTITVVVPASLFTSNSRSRVGLSVT